MEYGPAGAGGRMIKWPLEHERYTWMPGARTVLGVIDGEGDQVGGSLTQDQLAGQFRQELFPAVSTDRSGRSARGESYGRSMGALSPQVSTQQEQC